MDGRLYLGAGGGDAGFGALRCLDAATGEMLWEEKLNRKEISLTAADGKLIVLDESGNLFIGKPSPSGFGLVAKTAIPKGIAWRTTPVLCGGRIYCRDSMIALVCIDVRKR